MGFALSLVPLVVAGQFSLGTLRLTIGDQTSVSINAGSCGSNLTGTVTATLSGAGICSAMQLWVTQGECADAPTASDLTLPEIAQTTLQMQRMQNQSVNIPVNSMPYFRNTIADGGGGCGAAGVDTTHKFCAAVQMSNDAFCSFSKTTLKAQTPVTIRYDTQAPTAPVVSGAEPFDGAAAVTVTASDSDTASIQVQKKGPSDADFVTVNTVTTGGSTTIMGLTNGTTYEIRAIAFDAVMPTPNASEPSEVVTVTPRSSSGFWDACREAGCDAGCNVGAAGPLGLAALALLMLLRRMRR